MPDHHEMRAGENWLDVQLQGAFGLTRHLNEHHPLGQLTELVRRAEQDQAGLALLDHALRLTDDHRLRTGATDPPVELAVGGDDGPRPLMPRRGGLAPDDGGQGELHPCERARSPSRPSSIRRRVASSIHSILTGGAPPTSLPVCSASYTRSGNTGMSMLRNPGSLEGVDHGVDEGGRPAHRGALADALGAYRMVGAGVTTSWSSKPGVSQAVGSR